MWVDIITDNIKEAYDEIRGAEKYVKQALKAKL